MSYIKIKNLPFSIPVDPNTDRLPIEQDITRQIAPLQLISEGIPLLPSVTTVDDPDNQYLPLTLNKPSIETGKITVTNLLNYLQTNPTTINYCLYVAQNTDASDFDDDTNFPSRGRNEDLPYATIKKACAKIAALQAADTNTVKKQYTIFVKSGDYTEANPLYLPPNTSLIGDNLRRVSIRPANPTMDIFWVNNACYIWGVTFRGHKSPSAAVAFPLNTKNNGYVSYITSGSFDNAYSYTYTDANSNFIDCTITPPTARPNIIVSPYTQGCTSYATSSDFPNQTGAFDAGCGMRIDGSLVDGKIKSMVIDSFTQVNQGGKGVHLLNHAYAQFVSTFTVCTTEGILVENGATCSVSTSNCTFGLSGLVARGKSTVPILSGTFGTFTPGDNKFIINNPVALPVSVGNNNDVQYICSVPYIGTCFNIAGLKINEVNPLLNSTDLNNFFVNLPVTKISNSQYQITLDANLPNDLSAYYGSQVLFYARSIIETGSHTFEYMGTGTVILSALPAYGGQVNNDNEVVFDGLFDSNAPGIVYYTSSNEKGNFKVGPSFEIVQSTGTIEGDTFKKSILTLVTPLTIALE